MGGKYIEPFPVASTPVPDRPSRWRHRLQSLRDGVPGQCAVCRAWDQARVCRSCTDRFAAPRTRCRHCAVPVSGAANVCGRCVADPPVFDAAVAAIDYEFPWSGLIARLKFAGSLDLAAPLAALLNAALHRHAAAAVQLVLPVPLSAQRLRERGFNQAWEIARRLDRSWGRVFAPDVLARIRDTPHQIGLPRQERAANVRDAFIVETRQERRIEGCDVALVDDVATTTTTAAEVARTLKRAGARSVQLWVVARTPLPDAA